MASFFNQDFWRGVVGNLLVYLVLSGLMSTTALLAYRRIKAGLSTRWDTLKFGFEVAIFLFFGFVALRLSTLHDIQAQIAAIQHENAESGRHRWPLLTNSQNSVFMSRLFKIEPKEAFFVTCNDANCDDLASQISNDLIVEGFKEGAPVGSSVAGIADGISVLADDENLSAHKVRHALQEALGKNTTVGFFPDKSQGLSIIIIVGVRR